MNLAEHFVQKYFQGSSKSETDNKESLVGGFLHPCETYARQNWNLFSKLLGKKQTYFKPPKLLFNFLNNPSPFLNNPGMTQLGEHLWLEDDFV